MTKLSEKECELLALIPQDGEPVTSNELIEKLFGKKRPIAARSIFGARIGTLTRKLDAMKKPVKITKTERNGPHPISYRLVRR